MATHPPQESPRSEAGSDAESDAGSSSDYIIYGSYELRRGDRDRVPSNGGAPRWGGQDGATRYDNSEDLTSAGRVWNVLPYGWREGVEQGMNNALSVPAYVTELQHDLMDLGFGVIREANGVFGLYTEWAVREFQIYAGMEQVAQEAFPPPEETTYLERLEPVENDRVYDGPVSGVVNEATRRRIKHWVEQGWRCPVVVQARTGEDFADIYDGDGLAEGADPGNLWRHDDLQDSGPRVFVRDFTEYYDFEGTEHEPDEMIVLGEYAEYMQWCGPVSLPPRETWDNREIMPALLVGVQAEEMTDAQVSTFKIIRAVSEIECVGFFDSINSSILRAGLRRFDS